MARCTGECCRSFTLSRGREMWTEPPADPAHPWARLAIRLELISEAPAYALFTCREWDATSRRCKAYEDRPDTCRDYPYGGEHTCSYCGARSASEAAGTALQVASVFIPAEPAGPPQPTEPTEPTGQPRPCPSVAAELLCL